jgi:hypothetical protein
MDFLEKDLEEIIYNSDKKQLRENGLCLMFDLKKQVKIGNYGIADLIHHRRPFYHKGMNEISKGLIEIIELKNKKIGVSTFFQALNYLQGIKTYLAKRGMEDYYDYNIILIGRELDTSSSFCYLGDIFNYDCEDKPIYYQSTTNVHLFKYNFNLNGLIFNKINGYNLIDKGF